MKYFQLQEAVTALIKINNSKANHNQGVTMTTNLFAVTALIKINNSKANHNYKMNDNHNGAL